MSKQKLELTWMGKEKRPKLEPRILLEGREESYHAKHRVSENDIFGNRLIFGDNLLALKALEQEFSGKVKCVYIDPPFNTGEAFEHYDDGLEHSIWLDLMAHRIRAIHRLLREDGSLFIHIDDNELAYLIALCDEVFGRKNRINIITFKQSSASGPKATNPGLVTTANYIIFYAKDKSLWSPNRIYQAVPRDDRYANFILNVRDAHANWRIVTLREAFAQHHRSDWGSVRAKFSDKLEAELNKFVLAQRDHVIQLATVREKDINEDAKRALQESVSKPGIVVQSPREDREDYYFLNGKQVLFYKNKVKRVSGVETSALAASNIWDDLLSNNVHQEGGVSFPKGKKPEALLERILSFASNPGDLVLDSFAGSGTTGAVAHKMGRRWIMIELGEHCHTHIIPRLRKAIDGEDNGGITESVGWKGGGGFRYYRLAPSLIVNDRWGNPVINPEYNAAMLAEALAKLEGFTYAPSETHWWQHGRSSERDFVYVTTQNLSADQLQVLSEEVGADQSLLVCCAAFRGVTAAKAAERWPNLTLKKIPKMVLTRCEWGQDDYSLNVANLPIAQFEKAEPVASGESIKKTKSKKTALVNAGQGGLFGESK
ncbi:site-specific DNA-methyltransferase [Ralstonia syzygii]|uniref:site-specific DNA-methyltransferase (adenine-specific) n=1 Tax=Ralstonia syzygii R24 TaxID=907261 RepID=G3A337_9RALS|nr:site-specific DNA-methyltransferase [Ralstonia syzygii]CCA88281.1 site-specific DNA-methyltransferase (adenine-specific) [Ralstonia syzygii R24]